MSKWKIAGLVAAVLVAALSLNWIGERVKDLAFLAKARQIDEQRQLLQLLDQQRQQQAPKPAAPQESGQ